MRIFSRQHKGDKVRMDAFTDGAFAIIATLLVLEIRIPKIPDNHTQEELLHSLFEVMPSFIGFAFSFLTIMIYWLNHDHLSQFIKHYTPKFKALNLLLIFWLCLVPFTTGFIAEYPTEKISVIVYGTVLLCAAITGNLFYRLVAFKTDVLNNAISLKTRKKFSNRMMGGPVLYALATLSAFLNVYIAIGFYLVIPLLFIVLPRPELVEDAESQTLN